MDAEKTVRRIERAATVTVVDCNVILFSFDFREVLETELVRGSIFLFLQIDLKLKVCRGASARKVLVQQATSFGVDTVILGTSKTHHAIRSSVSVAKYCVKKLPKCLSVFAVDNNSKIAFCREASRTCSDQGFFCFSYSDMNMLLINHHVCFTFVRCRIVECFVKKN